MDAIIKKLKNVLTIEDIDQCNKMLVSKTSMDMLILEKRHPEIRELRDLLTPAFRLKRDNLVDGISVMRIIANICLHNINEFIISKS